MTESLLPTQTDAYNNYRKAGRLVAEGIEKIDEPSPFEQDVLTTPGLNITAEPAIKVLAKHDGKTNIAISSDFEEYTLKLPANKYLSTSWVKMKLNPLTANPPTCTANCTFSADISLAGTTGTVMITLRNPLTGALFIAPALALPAVIVGTQWPILENRLNDVIDKSELSEYSVGGTFLQVTSTYSAITFTLSLVFHYPWITFPMLGADIQIDINALTPALVPITAGIVTFSTNVHDTYADFPGINLPKRIQLVKSGSIIEEFDYELKFSYCRLEWNADFLQKILKLAGGQGFVSTTMQGEVFFPLLLHNDPLCFRSEEVTPLYVGESSEWTVKMIFRSPADVAREGVTPTVTGSMISELSIMQTEFATTDALRSAHKEIFTHWQEHNVGYPFLKCYKIITPSTHTFLDVVSGGTGLFRFEDTEANIMQICIKADMNSLTPNNDYLGKHEYHRSRGRIGSVKITSEDDVTIYELTSYEQILATDLFHNKDFGVSARYLSPVFTFNRNWGDIYVIDFSLSMRESKKGINGFVSMKGKSLKVEIGQSSGLTVRYSVFAVVHAIASMTAPPDVHYSLTTNSPKVIM